MPPSVPVWAVYAALGLFLLQALALSFGSWCVYVLVVNLLRRNEDWEQGVWRKVPTGDNAAPRYGMGPEGLPYLIGLSRQKPAPRRTTDR